MKSLEKNNKLYSLKQRKKGQLGMQVAAKNIKKWKAELLKGLTNPFTYGSVPITGPILFLDNCSAHPNDEELVSDVVKIIAKYFPPNVTALIQPMDQGLLESIKRVYRKYILRGFVCQMTFTI